MPQTSSFIVNRWFVYIVLGAARNNVYSIKQNCLSIKIKAGVEKWYTDKN